MITWAMRYSLVLASLRVISKAQDAVFALHLPMRTKNELDKTLAL